jgi:hypothetical protein
MKILIPGLICALTFFIIGTTNAQQSDSTKLYRIETKDGNEFLGKILSEDEAVVNLRTESLGDITIKRTNIVKITVIEPNQIKTGQLWLDNPQATRYFWSPNGYGLKKGEAYYQNVWVLFNQASIGLSNNFSIGLGLIPLFLFGAGTTPIWLTPKFSIPVKKDKFNIGAGALVATVAGGAGEGIGEGFGLLYGITTFGDRNKNLSVGVGYGFAGGELARNPTITVSSLIRLSRRGYFLTENYFIGTGDEPLILLSFGGRSIINRTGLDYGLFIPTETGGSLFAIPWLGLTVPLSK